MSTPPEAFTLTQQQKSVVECESNFFLTACPGSGKTRTTAARIARLMDERVSVAACSYTNVGVDAMRQALAAEHQTVVDPRHFVGTLHGLLLRHITYPFGHLTYGVTLRLLRDESAMWPAVDISDGTTRRISLPLFRMQPDGSMRMASVPYNVGLSVEEVLRRGTPQARRLKREMAAKGWVSSDDAMYIALRILREHAAITRAVAGRYEELIVDEAQDTSELQLECLRLLMACGALRSLVLVGDADQAISSFTGASAHGCDALATACALRRLQLDENFRSSRKICDLAAQFRSRSKPDEAVGPDADHALAPEFVIYPSRTPAVAVAIFTARLAELGEDPRRSAVLTRTNDLRNEIDGGSGHVKVSPRALALGKVVAKLRSNHTLSRRDIERIDRIISWTAFDDEEVSVRLPYEREAIRNASTELLATAPPLSVDLRTWIRGAATRLTEVSRSVTMKPARSGGSTLRSSATHTEHMAHNIFQPPTAEISAQTVHDIKGESRDAVLIVLDRQRGSRQPQSAVWARRLSGDPSDPSEEEEIRIAFVALTRARRYCLVAVPDDSSDESIATFSNAGLRLLDGH